MIAILTDPRDRFPPGVFEDLQELVDHQRTVLMRHGEVNARLHDVTALTVSRPAARASIFSTIVIPIVAVLSDALNDPVAPERCDLLVTVPELPQQHTCVLAESRGRRRDLSRRPGELCGQIEKRQLSDSLHRNSVKCLLCRICSCETAASSVRMAPAGTSWALSSSTQKAVSLPINFPPEEASGSSCSSSGCRAHENGGRISTAGDRERRPPTPIAPVCSRRY